MRVLWCCLMVACIAGVKADEASDPEGLMDPATEVRSTQTEYVVFVGRWTECLPFDDHHGRPGKRSEGMDSLVHTPVLGLQRRQIQCRKKNGTFVEPMYCGVAISQIGSSRVCIVRQQCSLAEWLPWRPKPDGALARTRRLRKLPQGGGKDCDIVEEVKPVTLEVNAHWAAGVWGECKVAIEPSTIQSSSSDDNSDDGIYENDDDDDNDDETAEYNDIRNSGVTGCGGGIQRREVMCVRADGRKIHDSHCAHTPMPTLVQPCEVPCPRDCEVGKWSEWSPCQPTDGCPLFPVQQLTTTGYSVRHRRVTSAASGGGAPCPPLEEKRTCSAPRCASWQALPWGSCVLNQPHTTCGPGRRTRELRCVGHDGKEAQRAWCTSSGAPARSERCRIACAGDCVVSSWGPWSPCSASCSTPGNPPPTRTRHRHILAHSSPDGWPCPPPEQLVQQESCNRHACATYSWLATPWGSCQTRTDDYIPPSNYTDFLDSDTFSEIDEQEPCIEEGEMSRDVMCVQNNADVVREALCSPLRRPASRRACTVRCRRGCKVEAWMPWSPCPNNCTPGKQMRVRTVHGGPNCGAIQETRECPVNCKTKEASWITGEWSPCRLPPAQRCGYGYKVRSIWCGSDSHRVESGSCAGQVTPLSANQCHVPCNNVPQLTCRDVCTDPLKYLDSTESDVPNCTCRNVSLELLPADSDCVLPPGLECGEGRTLRAARCTVNGRDVPLDVCKKYHPLSGPRRVREATTDGLNYDEEQPNLLRGTCTVRCARDCAVGSWGEWGPCAAEAGSLAAFRFRTREVIEDGTGGGRECGATLQRCTCIMSAARWTTGEWSVCAPRDALCGRAIINRTITCTDAEGNVLPKSLCEANGQPPSHEAACRAPCPSDCVVSSWSEWSPCEQTKWGGRRDRTRVMLRPAADGGTECPPLVEAEPCAPHAYSWHVAPWDDCQPLGGSPCGEGIKKRSVRCLRSDGVFVNDSFCPNATATETKESWCYVPCGVDCELSDWSEWDSSACTCGDVSSTSHMRRTRQRLTATVWPGRACGPIEQRAPCPRVPCMRLVSRPFIGCHVQAASGKEAIDACGWGVRVIHVRCELISLRDELSMETSLEPWRCAPTMPGRIINPLMPDQEEQCEVECGCVSGTGARGGTGGTRGGTGGTGAWGPWGPCRGGARSRTRQLLRPPNNTCRTSSRFVTIEWSNCTNNNEIRDLVAVETIEDKPKAWQNQHHDLYHEYIKDSLFLALAIFVLILYGAYIIFRLTFYCLRSRKLKTITKV